LVLRMLAAESKEWLYRIQTGRLSPDQMKNLYNNGVQKLSKLNIKFDESSHISVRSISSKARRLKKKGKLKMILIDYIQLMAGVEKAGNREREIALISRDLKNLATELDVPVIVLSQLSREGVKTVTWEYGPPASALRESGALEQDADLVLMLWGATDQEINQDPSLNGKRRVKIVKQRNGVVLTVELDFKNEIQLFSAIDKTVPAGYKSVVEANNESRFTDNDFDPNNPFPEN
ncbi:MAG TPA: DnaB-like helicase C-terminal domain-containing protein, partial [Chitinophagaceae bacterium]|nr:DnaB-like helicase C-terminal domain-containing protein [Chitinophagaceae bacterium]